MNNPTIKTKRESVYKRLLFIRANPSSSEDISASSEDRLRLDIGNHPKAPFVKNTSNDKEPEYFSAQDSEIHSGNGISQPVTEKAKTGFAERLSTTHKVLGIGAPKSFRTSATKILKWVGWTITSVATIGTIAQATQTNAFGELADKIKNFFLGTPEAGRTGTDIQKPLMNGTKFEESGQEKGTAPNDAKRKLEEILNPAQDPKAVPVPTPQNNDSCESEKDVRQTGTLNPKDNTSETLRKLEPLKKAGALLIRPRTELPEALRPAGSTQDYALAGVPLRVWLDRGLKA